MKNIFIVILSCLFFGCNTNQQKKFGISDSELQEAKTAFLELSEILRPEGGKLWNFSLVGPVILVNRETRSVIANEPDDNGLLSPYADVFIGTLPEEIIIANTAVEWNGKRWTMVALPLPENKTDRISLLIHESFHRIQPQLGFDGLNQLPNDHLDSKAGRIYLKMELEALKQALRSDNPENHILNALIFRQYRYQLFPGADSSENTLEISEGLAEYTGSILSGMDDKGLKLHYISKIDQLYLMPSFVRSFAYFTIPVYGYLMKQSDGKWNQKVNKKTNLTGFISGFYKVIPSKLAIKDIERIGKSYGWDSIVSFEENREQERLKLIKQYKLQFLTEAVFSIVLEKMEIGFDPKNIIPLEEYGSVYPKNMKIIDNWGLLEVDSCGALVSPNWDKVTITNPIVISDTLISGRGWKLKLNKYYQLQKEGKGFKLVKK
jgi:hypothetical protein